MKVRILEINDIHQAKVDMRALGVDPAGIEIMAGKAISRVLKLKSLLPVAANIIKQEMLSLSGEAAVAYGSINHSVDSTDVLVFGTLKQINLLANKLLQHQFGLPEIAAQIMAALNNYQMPPKAIEIGHKKFEFGKRTYIMGILNVTPDSFSDGAQFMDTQKALEHARQMLNDGADIIDIGGESSRPGSLPISAEEEIKRVRPIIEGLKKQTEAIISIDTTKSEVAEAALLAGASMLNDISGLNFDPKMAKVAADFGVPVCIMHMQGSPKNMQKNPVYCDLLGEIITYLEQGLEIAKKAGILQEKMIVDPGIGFGKTVEHNLEILKRLRELKVLGLPILVGPSRKSLIGDVLNLPVAQRLEGTAATIALSIAGGADIIRVHDVAAMQRVAKMADAIVRREKDAQEEKKENSQNSQKS